MKRYLVKGLPRAGDWYVVLETDDLGEAKKAAGLEVEKEHVAAATVRDTLADAFVRWR